MHRTEGALVGGDQKVNVEMVDGLTQSQPLGHADVRHAHTHAADDVSPKADDTSGGG